MCVNARKTPRDRGVTAAIKIVELGFCFPSCCHSDVVAVATGPFWVGKDSARILPIGRVGRFLGIRWMNFVKSILVAIALFAAVPATAEERVTLGWGRMFTNDAVGDGHDRWRTGGYQVSRVRGYSWNGKLPSALGTLLEFRAASQIVAPRSLSKADPTDRRYAGVLSFGLHSQMAMLGNELSLGADLAIVGPQTGISNFQNWIHNSLGMSKVSVSDNQIGNAIYPTLVAEVGRRFALGDRAEVRPFIETQVGLESFVRAGGDLVFGAFGRDDLMVRDAITGNRYRAVEGTRDPGVSVVLGGDISRVFGSALLPSGGAAEMKDNRSRLRAGMQWQGTKASVFYGVTYLSPEFDSQDEGQVLGALNLHLRF